MFPQAKQKWHITLDRSFPATANLRNEAMMHEAAEFAVHLKRCEKDIRTLKNATEGGPSAVQLHLFAALRITGACDDARVHSCTPPGHKSKHSSTGLSHPAWPQVC